LEEVLKFVEKGEITIDGREIRTRLSMNYNIKIKKLMIKTIMIKAKEITNSI